MKTIDDAVHYIYLLPGSLTPSKVENGNTNIELYDGQLICSETRYIILITMKI